MVVINKLLAFITKDKYFRGHFFVLLMVIVVVGGLRGCMNKQSQKMEMVRQERALVLKIDAMKNRMIPDILRETFVDVTVVGVIYENQEAFVLIDHTIYKEGGVVGDYKIVQVTKESITLLNVKTDETEHIIFKKPPEAIVQ